MKLLVGADPEIWIYDNKLGKIISAAGLFPGTKEEPFRVNHGAIQVDGMAAEYNIDPARNSNEFVYHNLSVMCDLRDEIAARNPDLDFKFEFTPVAEFGAEYIASQPEEAKRLGCTPDFNAYTDGGMNPIPDADMPFRTASGHIHIGWTKDMDIDNPEFIEACCMMVKQLDCNVGVNAAFWEGPEGFQRRELYGKAGAFRPKSYGVEYRTASNCWLSNLNRMQGVYNKTREAFEDLLAGARYYEMPVYQNVRTAIDTLNGMSIYANYEYPDPISDITMDKLDSYRRRYERYVGDFDDDGDFGLDDEDNFFVDEDEMGDNDFEPQPWPDDEELV